MSHRKRLFALLLAAALLLGGCMSSPPDTLKRESADGQPLISASTSQLEPDEREMMRKAAAVITVSLTAVFILSILLLAVMDVSITDALFETVSACATVGLSRGLTASLNTAGRVIIIIAMYLGRIGPISMAIFLTGQNSPEHSIQHAAGNFYVG